MKKDNKDVTAIIGESFHSIFKRSSNFHEEKVHIIEKRWFYGKYLGLDHNFPKDSVNCFNQLEAEYRRAFSKSCLLSHNSLLYWEYFLENHNIFQEAMKDITSSSIFFKLTLAAADKNELFRNFLLGSLGYGDFFQYNLMQYMPEFAVLPDEVPYLEKEDPEEFRFLMRQKVGFKISSPLRQKSWKLSQSYLENITSHKKSLVSFYRMLMRETKDNSVLYLSLFTGENFQQKDLDNKGANKKQESNGPDRLTIPTVPKKMVKDIALIFSQYVFLLEAGMRTNSWTKLIQVFVYSHMALSPQGQLNSVLIIPMQILVEFGNKRLN